MNGFVVLNFCNTRINILLEISADVKILSNVKFWVSALALDFIMVFRFLRGGSEAQVLLFQEDSLQNHNHFLTDPGHGHEYTDRHSTYGDLKAGHHSGDPVSDWNVRRVKSQVKSRSCFMEDICSPIFRNSV